jgi:hypothetical protein
MINSKLCARTLQRLRAEYEAGDKAALAMAISLCAHSRKPLPAWATEAWDGGWTNVAMRVADWNDLLGDVRVKTPKQVEREQMKREQLCRLVRLLPTVNEPIERDSEGAFRELADKIGGGIKPRAVRELYYAHMNYNGKKVRLLPSWVLRRRTLRK